METGPRGSGSQGAERGGSRGEGGPGGPGVSEGFRRGFGGPGGFGGPEGFPGRVAEASVHPGPRAGLFGPGSSPMPLAQAMADPSLLSAELEADEEEEAALRRLLLQVTPDREETLRPGPARAVTPQPGLCVKTRAGGDKVFVNVCHSPEVPPPPPVSPPGLQRLLREPPGPDGGFRIPMSLGEPHAELDRAGRGCTAYDVVVNSGFFRTLQADPLYLEFFLTVAMEGLSEKYGVELELTGWRVLRNRKFLGSISAQNIRAQPRPHIQELPGPPDPPQFVVVAEPSAQDPKVLQARVHLPQLA
ncbi:PIH1 domain-containing protein 1-like isoform X5 [Hirundo rustica]|uniref:PIH1 domain-containing protein 1-like isoform X5 n=1 Tax=Hirundo rustica TaxID=43150 RepID=UPI0026734638|nr:PIH1 domain-containing protein 1-like isoform X5 [Hirundo rustica]